jgi:hypothetical protein
MPWQKFHSYWQDNYHFHDSAILPSGHSTHQFVARNLQQHAPQDLGDDRLPQLGARAAYFKQALPTS